MAAIRQPAQCRQIQVIVVIVAEEHDIDAGKILPQHARIPAAARTDPAKRTGTIGPNGVGQNVGTALLEQNGGMVDQRNPQLAARHIRRRLGWLDVRHKTWGWLGTAGELPSKGVDKAARPGGARLVKALSVKVLGKSWVAGTLLHPASVLFKSRISTACRSLSGCASANAAAALRQRSTVCFSTLIG